MAHAKFSPLPLDEWRPCRDTIHSYVQVLGAVRRALTPPRKHWWHVSTRLTAAGPTTTPIPAGGMTFDMLLDLTSHELRIATSRGGRWQMPLRGQSSREFMQAALGALHGLGVDVTIDESHVRQVDGGQYDAAAAENYWRALSQIDVLLKQFQAELRRETSPVQLWPHQFDLSLVWFSGNLVPGVDPDDAENADEQMSFGFSTGDASVPEPYFYVTAYPWPPGLDEAPLPPGATWFSAGWKGALMNYEEVVRSPNPEEKLLEFWRHKHKLGSTLMSAEAAQQRNI